MLEWLTVHGSCLFLGDVGFRGRSSDTRGLSLRCGLGRLSCLWSWRFDLLLVFSGGSCGLWCGLLLGRYRLHNLIGLGLWGHLYEVLLVFCSGSHLRRLRLLGGRLLGHDGRSCRRIDGLGGGGLVYDHRRWPLGLLSEAKQKRV